MPCTSEASPNCQKRGPNPANTSLNCPVSPRTIRRKNHNAPPDATPLTNMLMKTFAKGTKSPITAPIMVIPSVTRKRTMHAPMMTPGFAAKTFHAWLKASPMSTRYSRVRISSSLTPPLTTGSGTVAAPGIAGGSGAAAGATGATLR